ncbi:hypothetical protein LDENG_00194770 [Lucifuga dentata]|nr:hypothetical protein LDENG_00194770 [Lucifuga dentata]
MDPARGKRREEISKALAFIQSPLAYPEPEGYKDFLIQLACNLLEEGNALLKDGAWELAVREFTEGLNVIHYAAAEEIHIPETLLENLYVSRAAAYHSTGEPDRGLQDCDRALEVCKGSHAALYRKALCLKELGRHKEAYNCTAECLLITQLDAQVNALAQELAAHLGLKNRKPYISAKEETIAAKGIINGNTAAQAVKEPSTYLGDDTKPLGGTAPVSFPSMPQSFVPSDLPSPRQPAVPSVSNDLDTLDDTELMGEDLDSLLDCFPNEQTHIQASFSDPSTKSTSTSTVPSILPAPTPQLPPAFFNSAVSQLNSLDSFSATGGKAGARTSTLDSLDDLLTSHGLDALDRFPADLGGSGGTPKSAAKAAALDTMDGLDSLDELLDSTLTADAETEPEAEEKSLDGLLDKLNTWESISSPRGQTVNVPKTSVNALDRLDSLDALDSFDSGDGAQAALSAVATRGKVLDSLSDFSSPGSTSANSNIAPFTRSPKNNYTEKKKKKERNKQGMSGVSNCLSATHEFLQACSACFPREGVGIYTFVHKPTLVHSCKQDILLCRRKSGVPSEWTRVREIPAWTSFSGPFVLCRELLKSGDLGLCKYGEKCTFAFNQLEIDVWTEERKGTLHRDALFEMTPVKLDPVNSIIRLLQEDMGMFMFLCQKCYDSKPRIIGKRRHDDRTICSNMDTRHVFDANKCLVFVRKTTTVNYRKVRPLNILCYMDLCRQALRYGCQREDSCHFAHSIIELKTWKIQRDTGISPDEIVKISIKYHEEQNSSKHKVNTLFSSAGGGGSKPRGGGGGGAAAAGKSPNMKMKFVCAQCWWGGLVSEPDKTLKYCTAKARHTWTKERPILLVKSLEKSKWVQVRPLPHAKNFPMQYDICTQIIEKRKCTYSGNCTFAHSQEERDMWMYMKNNDLRDMQQIYDMWLSLTFQNRQADGAVLTQPVLEEKCIVMPSDYAEPMTGFHCRLCGKHSNSERQWQQHISTEKHKDRVFSCEGEDEALTWSYRFPGTRFQLCPKLDGECPEGVSCDFAHSPEELQEWAERRDFLRRKLAKAREDMLIMPDEFDFGKYNFLLQD